MDAGEFFEWIAFDRIHQRPEDVRTAQLCLMIDHACGGKGKLDDYLPEREGIEEERPEDWRRLMAMLGARCQP